MEFRDIITAGILHEISDEAKRKLKKAGKIGAGAAALGGAGVAAYQNREKLGEMAKEAKDKVENRFTNWRNV